MSPDRSNTSRAHSEQPGANIARLLSGAWAEVSSSEFQVPSSKTQDQSPKTKVPALSESDLADITPLLCHLGAGALAWCKIRNTPLATTTAGAQLHEVYRRQRLSALLHERDIVDVLSRFRAAGIEAILVKGWAVARRYPDRALRPYGDIDLCVAPAQFAQAKALVASFANIAGPFVDLHSGFDHVGVGKQLKLARLRKWFSRSSRVGDNSLECGDLSPLSPAATRRGHGLAETAAERSGRQAAQGQSGDRSPHSKELDNDWDELYARSQVVTLDEKPQWAVGTGRWVEEDQRPKTQDQSSRLHAGFPVRILSDEDHLRILCLHLLRSGARRPGWLCDVAVIIDGLRSLDFGLCASFSQSPKSKIQSPSFDWSTCVGRNPVHAAWVGVAIRLAHEVLGVDIDHTPFRDLQLPRWLAPALLHQWGGRLWTDLYARWNNPIRSVAAVGGNFTERSRLGYRVAELVARTPEVPDHLRSLWQQVRA